uniref:Uncharacterized protein n=1 Tax=Photinus pyralis TaxID=7054 RepID=A0A1Y1L5Y2_PHOPY
MVPTTSRRRRKCTMSSSSGITSPEVIILCNCSQTLTMASSERKPASNAAHMDLKWTAIAQVKIHTKHKHKDHVKTRKIRTYKCKNASNSESPKIRFLYQSR